MSVLPIEPLIRLKEAMHRLGIARTAINGHVRRGELSIVSVGRLRMVKPEALREFIAQRSISALPTLPPLTKTSIPKIKKRRRNEGRAARGTGSIRRRCRELDSGSQYVYWEGRVSLGLDSKGRRIQKTVTGKTEDAVVGKMRQIYQDVPTNLDTYKMTVADLARDYLSKRKNGNLNTYRTLESALRLHALPEIGNLRLPDLSRQKIQQLMDSLASAEVGTRAQQSTLKAVKALVHHAYDRGLLPDTDASNVRTPKHRKKYVHVPSALEVERLLDAAGTPDLFTLILATYELCARQGEIFALRWNKVDLESGHVTLDGTLTADEEGHLVVTDTKTEASRRRLPISRRLLFALSDLRTNSHSKPTDFVFATQRGTPLHKSNFDRRVFHPLRKVAGLGYFTPHSLRKAGATTRLERGDPLSVVQGFLGHEDARMTLQSYVCATQGAMERSRDTLDLSSSDAIIEKPHCQRKARGGLQPLNASPVTD